MGRNSNKKLANDVPFALSCMFMFIGLLLLLFPYFHERDLAEFEAKGIHVEAKVLGKEEHDSGSVTVFYLKVSYFDKGILEGGKLHIVETCNMVNAKVWDAIDVGERIDMLYLPDEPDEPMPVLAFDDAYRVPLERYSLGLWVIGVSSLILLVSIYAHSRAKA